MYQPTAKRCYKYPTCHSETMSLRLVLVLLALLALTQAEVAILDDSNFTSYVEANPHVFVKFYAPWCGHCKSMAPDYEKLGEAAAEKDYKIAKVDATVAEKVAKEEGVEGFPTLKFYVNKQAIPYSGGRKAEEMQQWIESYFTSKIVTLSEAELKEKIGSEDFLLIQSASADDLKTLELANFLDSNLNYFNLEGAEGDLKLTLHLKNSKTFEYTGEVNAQAIKKWSVSNSLSALVPLRGQEESVLVFENEGKLPAFLLAKAEDYTPEVFSTLESICEENKDKFVCAYADKEMSIFKGVAGFLKMEEDSKSVLAFLTFGLKQGYAFPNPTEITNEAVTQFLADVEAGKVDKLVDSEKEKADKHIEFKEVVQLTGDTYNQTIENNDYVFVKYYSPSCGHCVKFAPEYEKLAAQVKEDGGAYVIAAVDMSAHPDTIGKWVNIEGFPTLHLYVKGNKVAYNGPRSAEAIINFIGEAANSKINPIASIEEAVKPSVVIYNIKDDSPLHLLPSQFTRMPIYHLNDESGKFKAEIFSKETHHFEGAEDLDLVLEWIEESTEPVVVDALSQPAPKKLTHAIDAKKPLLILAKRDQAGEKVHKLLEEFCTGRHEFVCAYASKDNEGYEPFNEWLGDEDNEKSKIVAVNSQDFSKSIYSGDLEKVNEKKLEEFVSEIISKFREETVEANVEEPAQDAREEPAQEAEKVEEQAQEKAEEAAEEEVPVEL